FTLIVPADTTARTLVMHVGGYNSSGMLTAHLSDGSAADFVDATAQSAGVYDRNYTLSYKAGSPNQTLSVTWQVVSGAGNVTLSGAALNVLNGTVTATAGSPQSTPINTAFATALQATVRDANNNPVPDVTVTFTAPENGASARFGSLTIATAVTAA